MTRPYPKPWSEKFPPKNRGPKNGLGPLDMRLLGKGGEVMTNPNELAVFAQTDTLNLGDPLDELSVLSGKPGYVYEDDEIRMVLTFDELMRFLQKNLDADEYFILAEHLGVFYSLRDYDEDTGIAQNPWYGPGEREKVFQRCLSGELEVDEFDTAMDHAVMEWHTDTSDVPLHRFLGMRQDELQAWIESPSRLLRILFERLRDYEPA